MVRFCYNISFKINTDEQVLCKEIKKGIWIPLIPRALMYEITRGMSNESTPPPAFLLFLVKNFKKMIVKIGIPMDS